MKRAECTIGMIVHSARSNVIYKVIGERGVMPDGTATATDCGAWVEDAAAKEDPWVVHWSRLAAV